MILNNRIIYSDNGVFTDLSVALNDYHVGTSTVAVVAAEDAIYVGSDLPFNHRFIEVTTANDQTSVMSVELFDGSSWNAAVDVIDQTAASGRTLAQSGSVSWNKDKRKGWARRDTADIPALSSLVIYNLFWARFKFTANLKSTTALGFVGQKFSNDTELAGYWPQLVRSEVYAQWDAGTKTSWNEQHYQSAEKIIQDLKKKGVIYTDAQVLNWEIFKEASIHKTAEIIMNAFGKDWEKPRDEAKARYADALDLFLFEIDKNQNTLLDESETIPTIDVVRR